MKSIREYRTAEAAFEGTKAEALAMLDYLRASIEGQTFGTAPNWSRASSMFHVGELVDQAEKFLNGDAE